MSRYYRAYTELSSYSSRHVTRPPTTRLATASDPTRGEANSRLVPQPAVIWVALAMIVINPANHFHSLAPPDSHGWAFESTPSLGGLATVTCSQPAAWNTPQLRALLYLYMGTLAFSAIIEPVVLYVAATQMESARDAERVVAAVLVAFAAFDLLHAGATVVVTGWERVLPGLESAHGGSGSGNGLDLYACINVWVPLAWLVIRSAWFAGVGRSSLSKVKSKQR